MFVRFLSRFGDKEVLNNAKLAELESLRVLGTRWHLPCCPARDTPGCCIPPGCHIALAALPPWHSRAGLAASTVPGALPERKSNVNMSSGCVCFREGALQRRRKSVLLIQKPHRRKLKVLGVSMEDMLKKQQLAHKRQQERKQEGKNCS